MPEVPKHPYISRRGSVYYYRRKVPLDLRDDYAPKSELVFSLRTSDHAEAQRKANIETVRIDAEFQTIRQRKVTPPATELTAEQISQIADDHLQQLLEEDEEVRFDGTGDGAVYLNVRKQLDTLPNVASTWTDLEATTDYGLSNRDYHKQRETQDWATEHYTRALSRGDVSAVFDLVDERLEESDVQLDRSSNSYRILAKEILKSTVRALEMIEQRFEGKVVETPAPTKFEAEAKHSSGLEGKAKTTCSQLWGRYADERQLPGKTLADFGTYMRRFIELHGDLLVAEVTKRHAREYRDAMLKLPARASGELKALKVPQILERVNEQPELQRLSPRTVNQKAIGALQSVFGYAVDNDLRETNPFQGVRAEQLKSFEPPRLPYSIKDLNIIFSMPVFVSGERPIAAGGEAALWLPLLALFTGARLEELGSLNVEDIQNEDVTDYIFIRGKLKSRSSRRKVPIHSELIRLGFLEYVQKTRHHGHQSLWPSLSSKRSEITAGYSKWWGRYVRKHGFNDTRKVFHSFRHLVKRQLRNAKVEKGLIDALQGHEAKDVADRYGLDEEGLNVSLPVLKDAIEKLAYPGLDLSYLYSKKRNSSVDSSS